MSEKEDWVGNGMGNVLVRVLRDRANLPLD